MRSFALIVSCLMALAAPAFAQKAEIDAANAKWIEFFNKGDFAGVASLYTEDASAFPPGAAMVKGRGPIAAMWKNMAKPASSSPTEASSTSTALGDPNIASPSKASVMATAPRAAC